MPAGVGSPFESAALAIKAAFDIEFAPEGITMRFDNLHASLGRKRVDVGIAPATEGDIVNVRNSVVQETWIEVKFYDLWKKEISPDTTVDPRKIAEYAERFRRCLQPGATDPHTAKVWFFDVRSIRYPGDPTGNKSRFVATLRAFGNNANLIETSG